MLSVFGWFFLVPEFLAVSLQWALYDPVQFPARRFWWMMALSVLAGGLFMGLLGPKEEGHEMHWALAYSFAGGTAAAWSLVAVRFAKSRGNVRGCSCDSDRDIADRAGAS
jgi:hypothetical protein